LRRTCRVLAGLTLLAGAATAQNSATLRRARAASEQLDFATTIRLARQATTEQLGRDDRILAFELLGYAYGALDSARQAVDAFRQLIFLAPDREPDVERVSPRITSLYASALGQVLVVRKVAVDSTTIVAGDGRVLIRYQVSRAARATTRVVGQGLDLVVDSQLVTGPGLASWNGLSPAGTAAPAGLYQVLVTASEGRNEFTGPLEIRVDRSAVDTMAHITTLPGYTFQPETESPPRNWRPLGLAVLYTGMVAGAAVALENTSLDLGERREVAGVASLAFVTGLVMSLKKPDARPVPANIQYNALLREQIAERNRQIAEENQRRRQQVKLTVTPVATGAP
jgi:hypothetical protein